MVEKVWGRDVLPSPFQTSDDQRIGEIWFEPPPELAAILIKYLFTSEKLSVQVHPSKENALAGEDGKEECWLILDAEPGAQLAIGFERSVTPAEISAAALDGSIEELLAWHEVRAGDFFHLPPGTVHAIGAGISLVEVQQNSDTTFRLYDYGRPRELHLERALSVAVGEPHADDYRCNQCGASSILAECGAFRLDRIEGAPADAVKNSYSGPLLALPLSGELVTEQVGHGLERTSPGECLLAPNVETIDFASAGVTLLVCAND